MEVILQAFVQGLTLAALYLPIALGLNLVFGVMHVLNFAHGELYMLGAMVTWWLLNATGIGYVPALLLSALLLAAFGALIERFAFRPMGDDILACLIISIGLSLVLQTSTLIVGGSDTKHYAFPLEGTLSFGEVRLSVERLSITVLGLLGTALFYLVLQKTKLGRAIRAVAQDREAATLQAINPGLITTVSMALGTALAAMGGALTASIFGVDPFMGTESLLFSVVIIVLGGLGSMEGTFLAGLLLGMVQSFITIYVGATEAAMAGFIVLYLVLLLRPTGLLGRAGRGGMI